MKRFLTYGFLLCLSVFLNVPQAGADSYYRINLRAYRRMMRFQGPHPLADRFFGFVDDHLLQTNGPADQFVNEFMKKLIDQINKADTTQQPANNDGMVAQRVVEPDQNLTDADRKVREMCKNRGITFIEIPKTPPALTQQNTPPDQALSNLDPNFFLPAPVEPSFTGPSTPPSKGN